MPRLLHIHCLSQTDSTTLRPDRNQDHHPCHQFANLYYSTSQRFFMPFSLLNTSIWNHWYYLALYSPYTIKWARNLRENHTMSAKNLAEWQVNQLKSNLHMFYWFVGDWDETLSDTKNIGKHCVLAFFQVGFHLRSIFSRFVSPAKNRP